MFQITRIVNVNDLAKENMIFCYESELSQLFSESGKTTSNSLIDIIPSILITSPANNYEILFPFNEYLVQTRLSCTSSCTIVISNNKETLKLNVMIDKLHFPLYSEQTSN